MKLPKALKLGDILEIEFLDHVEDGHAEAEDVPLRFLVFGRLARRERWSITVDCWAYKDPRAPRDSTNVKSYTIVRKAIMGIRILDSQS